MHVTRETGMIGAGAFAMLAIGLAVRLWGIGAEPLWLDEAYSAYAADHGFAFLWQIVPRYETHPPFYYALLRLWTLPFGNGLLALRAFGLIAGIMTLLVVALAAREAARLLGWDAVRRRRLTFAAFALASVALPLVEMARQVRPYPLMILVFAGAILALLRLARTGALRSRAFAAYLLLLEATLWLHNMGPLFAAALTLALGLALLHRRLGRRDWLLLAGSHAAVALAYLPGFMILLGQASGWVESTWLRFDWSVPARRLPPLYAVPGWPLLAAAALAGLALAACSRSAPHRRLAAMLVLLACLPVLLSILLSVMVAPVFIARTMAPAAVPALLLFAIGATAFTDWKRWLGVGSALILGANMLAVDIQARAAPPMQDWYPAVAWLRARFRPGDRILAYPNEGALPLAYALRDYGLALPIRPIPTAVPSLDEPGGRYPNGTRGVVSLPPARLRAIARELRTQGAPTLWLLRLAAPTYDPGDVFLHELERGRRIVSLWRRGPIDLIGLRAISKQVGPPAGSEIAVKQENRITPPPAPARNPR